MDDTHSRPYGGGGVCWFHFAGRYDSGLGAVCAMLAGMLAMRYDDDDIDAWVGLGGV